MPELFHGGVHTGAGGPNIIKKKVSSGRVDFDFAVQSESVLGLGETGFLVGTDLDGVFGAEENGLSFIMFKLGEIFSDFCGMVKTAASNMISGSGEGDDNDVFGQIFRQLDGEKFG